LQIPQGVAVDSTGNLYFSDTGYNLICKVNPNGILSIVAGNGTNGFSGDGGPATNASLSDPQALALDASGNLYIADQTNNRIRRVDTHGVITTVAGNGAGATGSAAETGVFATNCPLGIPCGVAFDAWGNLYLADQGSDAVLKMGTNGIVTLVEGAAIVWPVGVAVDAAGSIYTADYPCCVVTKVTTNGIANIVAGFVQDPSCGCGPIPGFSGDGGPATNALLYCPIDTVADPAGNLYITDRGNNRIRKVDTNGIITTVAGTGVFTNTGDGGPATNAGLAYPSRMAMDASGNLYVADMGNGLIRKISYPYAWQPTFMLNNLASTNAGNYSVVVSGPYGSVTSLVATLSVTIPTNAPQIVTGDGCFGFVTNTFGFNISAAFGQTIVVDGSVDLVHWTPLCTNTFGGGPMFFSDPCWTSFPGRFYRARLQ
jgi:sugar lactone lactonase YvrE